MNQEAGEQTYWGLLPGPEEQEQWICDCGARLDPVSPDWRFDGRNWQHYHGYPIGHVIVERTGSGCGRR